jgi:hypothetical protein
LRLSFEADSSVDIQVGDFREQRKSRRLGQRCGQEGHELPVVTVESRVLEERGDRGGEGGSSAASRATRRKGKKSRGSSERNGPREGLDLKGGDELARGRRRRRKRRGKRRERQRVSLDGGGSGPRRGKWKIVQEGGDERTRGRREVEVLRHTYYDS